MSSLQPKLKNKDLQDFFQKRENYKSSKKYVGSFVNQNINSNYILKLSTRDFIDDEARKLQAEENLQLQTDAVKKMFSSNVINLDMQDYILPEEVNKFNRKSNNLAYKQW